jgi:hypothetical protein
MTKVQVDQALLQKLGGLSKLVTLCEPDGRVVGRFLPERQYQQMLYAAVKIAYSAEEIARRRAERGGCTLDEIWKRLGQE